MATKPAKGQIWTNTKSVGMFKEFHKYKGRRYVIIDMDPKWIHLMDAKDTSNFHSVSRSWLTRCYKLESHE